MMNSKFAPLANYLKARGRDRITLSFSEIEEILGFSLYPSARKYKAYWNTAPTHRLPLVCEDAGYKVYSVHIGKETVTFKKSLQN